MKVKFVDLQAQYHSIKEEMDKTVLECLEQSDFIQGASVRNFEAQFAQFTGTEHCISCANGSDALEIALLAMGVERGDEIIVPANSFFATAEAVVNIGAEVVFCDVYEDSKNIDVSKIEALITDQTKVIIGVHLYGTMFDVDGVLEIANKHNLLVLEDAAQAHGAEFKGHAAGQKGHLATYSFYPGKNLGAYGDGGAIVTIDEALATMCRKIANHGRISKYNHEMVGRNSRLDALQARILSVKMPHLDGWIKERRRVAAQYLDELKDVSELVLPIEKDGYLPAYHLFVVRIAADRREAFMTYLKDQGVATGIHYPIALPLLQAMDYMGHTEADFPVAYQLSQESVSLPIFPELTGEEISYVCDQIKDFFK